jgi:hypothetical protein
VIDAVVTNKSGPVRGLTAKDFTVSVDGQEQSVLSAEIPARTAATKQLLILLFDNSTINAGDQERIRQQVEKFLDTAAKPDRYMAVLRWYTGMEIVQPFTNDPQKLKKALEKVAVSATTGTGSQGVLNSGFKSETSGRAVGADGVNQGTAGAGGVGRAQNLMQGLASLGEALAAMRGRKPILFISGGGYALGTMAELDSLVEAAMAACNRGNVALHGVSNDASFAAFLSSRTGGESIRITNSLTEAFTRMVEEQEASYKIAFTPSAEAASGCHQVKLKAGKGYDIYARKEYCAGKGADALAGTDAGRKLEAQAMGPAAGKMAVAMRVPFFYTAANTARAHVALDISVADLKFAKNKGKFTADLEVMGMATRADGAAGPRFSEVLHFSFDKQNQADAFRKETFPYEGQLELRAGKYTVRVAVNAGEAFGQASAPVEITPWAPPSVGMGGLALARTRRRASAGLAAGLDPEMLEGDTSLVANGMQILPVGTARFPASGSVAVYTEINPPAGGTARLQVRYVERASGKILIDSGEADAPGEMRAGANFMPIAFNIPLRQLPPGAYQVQLRASSGASGVIRAADFDVY